MSKPPDRRFILPASILGPALLCAALACNGGTDLFLPSEAGPARIQVTGDDQSGRVGEELAQPLVFVVTDSRSRPVPGARIALELTAAAPDAAIHPDTALTDPDGKAEATMLLGTRVGPQTGQARVLGADGSEGPSISFSVTALPENANGLAALSGDAQTGAVGSTLPQPLVVQVTDAFGNPISGVPITWTAPEGGSVSETSNLTDQDGRASVLRTLGATAGVQTTVATSEGLAGSPLTFTATATAGNASGLSIVSGNDQTAAAGTELPGDLVVRLVDSEGNGVPDAAVTWVVSIGGGQVSPQNTTTDEAGRASTRWTLGPQPGPNRVDAVVSGVGVVNFTATGTAVAPAALSVLTQPSGTVANGARLERQPVVQVRDGTPGVVITAQLSGGGGELLGTRQRTSDGSGRAAFTDLAISGAEGSRRLVFTAAGYAGATSSAIQVRPIGTSTTITSDSPDPSAAGQGVTVGFRVSSGGPVPTGSVTITVPDGPATCSGTLQGGEGSCQIVLNGAGQRTLQASYSGAPGLLRSSDAEGHQVGAATPENRAPHADFNSHCNGLTCDFVDGSSDPDGRVVAWSWNFGDGSAPVTQQNPTHTFLTGGRYEVALTATDDDGASHTTTKNVDVRAPPPPPPENQAPSADFSADCADLSCRFDNRSTDPDGKIASRAWTFGDGATSSEDNPRHDYAAANAYSVTLTVTDDDGASATVTKPVSVTRTNQGPHAEFQVDCPNPDLTCTFTDRSTDDVRVASWHWEFGDGQTFDGQNPPAHQYPSAQKFTVTLTVTDDDGASNQQTHDASPKPIPNDAPTAAFSNDPCVAGQPCQFTDQSTDDGQIVAWEWDFSDNGATSSEQNPSHTFSEAGSHRIRLTVRDNQGAENRIERDIDVAAPNAAPTAVIGAITCNGMDCSFTDASTDPNGAGTIQRWLWAFGDGSGSDVRNPTHTYSAAGNYTVSLTVADDHGASDGTTEPLTVEPPPETPAGIARTGAATGK